MTLTRLLKSFHFTWSMRLSAKSIISEIIHQALARAAMSDTEPTLQYIPLRVEAIFKLADFSSRERFFDPTGNLETCFQSAAKHLTR